MFELNQVDISQIIAGNFSGFTPFPQKEFITAAVLSKIMPAIPDATATALVPIFIELAPKYSLDSDSVFSEFIAQCAEECGQFTSFTESLNYSPQRMVEVWPHRFPTISAAMPYAHNPQALANNVYANRMGNGNEASGDGYLYRGGGALELTGHDMYKGYADYAGLDVADAAKKVRTDLYYIVDSAMWLFVIKKKLLDEALLDDYKSITKAINGGTTDLAKREGFLNAAKLYMAA